MSDKPSAAATPLPAETLQPQQQKPPEVPASPGGRRKFLRLAAVLIVVIAAIVIWRVFFSNPKVPESIVQLSGRIEGDDSAVSPKTSGRILEVRFREGAEVRAGEVIAVLDDQQVRAREEQARAALAGAQARSNFARAQIAILQEQLRGSELEAEQSKGDSQGRVRQAERPSSPPRRPTSHSRRPPTNWLCSIKKHIRDSPKPALCRSVRDSSR